MGLQDSVDACVGEYYTGIVGYDLRADLDTASAGTLESYRLSLIHICHMPQDKWSAVTLCPNSSVNRD